MQAVKNTIYYCSSHQSDRTNTVLDGDQIDFVLYMYAPLGSFKIRHLTVQNGNPNPFEIIIEFGPSTGSLTLVTAPPLRGSVNITNVAVINNAGDFDGSSALAASSIQSQTIEINNT